MKTKNIIIITDCKDVALEGIKARLTTMLPNNNIIFFNLLAKPFQITNGMFLSKLISDEVIHGENTLFLAVINPLKIKPIIIFWKLKYGTWFVGADTGIFSLLFNEFGIKKLYEGKNQKHYPFGGLHVHSVNAANLLNGILPEEIGNEINSKSVNNTLPKKYEVVHIDNFGLIKIWARIEDLKFSEGDSIVFKVNNSKKSFNAIFSNRMMGHKTNSLIVYPGSSLLNKSRFKYIEEYRKSGLIEIGLVRNPNSAKELNIKIGDIITFENS